MGNLKIGNNYRISESESIKYFGIYLDRNFRWGLQVKDIDRKLRGMLSIQSPEKLSRHLTLKNFVLRVCSIPNFLWYNRFGGSERLSSKEYLRYAKLESEYYTE